MKKLLFLVIALALVGTGLFLFFRTRGSSGGQAVLKVNATPTVTIFLNNENVGKSPYEAKHAAGEYTLKLIPETTTTSVVSWEGNIKLSPNLLTYVSRELGDSELSSSGEILTLEKTSGDKGELAVLSVPDSAQVTLSAEDKGTTPIVVKDLEPNNYELAVSAPGHKGRSVKIKATGGYKLTAEFQLSPSGEVVASPNPNASPGPSPSAGATPRATPRPSGTPTGTPGASPKVSVSPPPRPYVEILDTPTGFLRVREEPATSAEEVGRVNPGETYALLDEQSGWYKIEYESNSEGWISGQYAEKFE